MTNSEKKEVKRPKYKACFLESLPEGIGLKLVLSINESISDSYHIFKAPADPAPRATAIIDIIEYKKLISFEALISPTTQVKITSDITLGFINS